MRVTISTHNGSKVRRAHNIRNKSVTDKQEHIDTTMNHEIWKDETIINAYHRIFDKAVVEYNQKQKRAERRIKNYHADVLKDPKKHDCYEMVIGVYPYKDPETGEKETVPEYEFAKDILRTFVDGWKERNPNLEMIGAYYHADEPGSMPHVHIDYIPIAKGYTRGLSVQTGLRKALEQQGFYTSSPTLTAQIVWESRENKYLEDLCQSRGWTVMHEEEKREHEDTEEYKRKTAIEETKRELKKYSEMKVSIEGDDITVKNIPFGKVAVDKKDFKLMQEQAKGYRAMGKKKEQLESKEKELIEREKGLNYRAAELLDLRSSLEERERNITGLKRENTELRTELSKTEQENKRLRKYAYDIEKSNEKLNESLNSFIRILEYLFIVIARIVNALLNIDTRQINERERSKLTDTITYGKDVIHTYAPEKEERIYDEAGLPENDEIYINDIYEYDEFDFD